MTHEYIDILRNVRDNHSNGTYQKALDAAIEAMEELERARRETTLIVIERRALMAELKPCKCRLGYEPYIYLSVLDGWTVYCPGCGAIVTGNTDRQDAIEAWNRREGGG